jgi:twitching motility protein PilT
MGLSFTKEMLSALPEYLIGVNRFKNIDKLISFNADWKMESNDHLKTLLIYMRNIGASDIDFGGPGSNEQVWFRVYGKKSPHTDLGSYTNDEVAAIIISILSESQKQILFNKRNVDFSYGISLKDGEDENRFRGNAYFDSNSIVINFRRINQFLLPIKSLGFPELINRRMNLRYEKSGLFLITGITGSGKSTTLDSIVDMNNRNNHAHIVIIGNPIEYIHKSDKCLIRHRELGDDTLSFQAGTIQALRQDPDIIVVGEMRDPKTIATVMEATDSGHKCFSTLHTSSTTDSIHRIIAEFPPNEQERVRYRLADLLKVIVSQKLIPDRNGKLTIAKEILSVDASVQAAIRNKNIGEVYQMITEGKKKGMITLEQDLYNLYKQKIISQESAINYSNNKKRIMQLLAY